MASGIRRLALNKKHRANLTTGMPPIYKGKPLEGATLNKLDQAIISSRGRRKSEFGLGTKGTIKEGGKIRKTRLQGMVDVVSRASGSRVARGLGRAARIGIGAGLAGVGATPAAQTILTEEDRAWMRKVGSKLKKKK